MYTYIVGVSRNDRQVYASIVNSPAGRSFGRYPYLVRLVKDLVEASELTTKHVNITQDVGRNIGNTNIVTTEDRDNIFYAQQLKQAYPSRFVKNRSMEPSSELSIVLSEDSEGNYELRDVWIGPACPPFPGAPDACEESKAYWLNHALIAGSEPIAFHSMTSTCPY